jgi:hypothetical protein
MCDSDSIHQTQRSDHRGSYQKDIKAKDQIKEDHIRKTSKPKITSVSCIKLKYWIKVMQQAQISYQCYTSNPKMISGSYIKQIRVTSNPRIKSEPNIKSVLHIKAKYHLRVTHQSQRHTSNTKMSSNPGILSHQTQMSDQCHTSEPKIISDSQITATDQSNTDYMHRTHRTVCMDSM